MITPKQLVEIHVGSNISVLFQYLKEHCDGEDYEKLYALSVQQDYKTPAKAEEYYVEEMEGKWFWSHPDINEWSDPYLTEENAWQCCCSENDIEPYEIHALEHWIVSEWLACELEGKGEMVDRDLWGLCVWGRRTSSQSIYLDSVIQEIFEEFQAAIN